MISTQKSPVMKVSTRITNLGIELAIGDNPRPILVPCALANQKSPQRHYVYAHCDPNDAYFYIGKGVGRRAWSDDRHDLWHRYVQKSLNGKYEVKILKDNLSLEEAEELEADWIAQCGDSLVNWFNAARSTDFAALDRYHKLRNANRATIDDARRYEHSDPERAITIYLTAIEDTKEYAFMSLESGLVGRLIEEEDNESGINGELTALDRLSMCLIKAGRMEEAAQHAEKYFSLYKRDLLLKTSERIIERIKKAFVKKNVPFTDTVQQLQDAFNYANA